MSGTFGHRPVPGESGRPPAPEKHVTGSGRYPSVRAYEASRRDGSGRRGHKGCETTM